MKLQLIFLVFLLSLEFSAKSQIFVEVSHLSMQPLGAFKNNLPNNPEGMTLEFMGQIKHSKLYVGGAFGTRNYGGLTYPLEFDNGVVIDMAEYDGFMEYQALGRYYFFEKMFSPYAEARIGGRSFYSKKRPVDTEYKDLAPRTTDWHGTSLVGAIGGGVVFKIPRIPVCLDFNINVDKGTSTQYRNVKGLDYQPAEGEGIRESSITNIAYKVGLVFWLRRGQKS